MVVFAIKKHTTPLVVGLDTRHCYIVSFSFRGQPMVIMCVHMLQRNRGVRYTEVLSDIAQCGEALADGFIIVLGDFNRFVPEHPETLEFLDSMSAELVVQGTEGRLHKDWVATDHTRLRRVSYETAVADHPCILGHFVFTLDPVSGTSSSYRPVSVSCWSTDERLHFASLLEVFSAVCSSSEEWMFWYRECMGSVESFRRTNLARKPHHKKIDDAISNPFLHQTFFCLPHVGFPRL